MKIKRVVALGLIALFSILIVQLFWIQQAMETQQVSISIQQKEDSLERKEFDDLVYSSLLNVLAKIQRKEGLTPELYGAIRKAGNAHFTVAININEELPILYLENLLKREFYLKTIQRDFYCGVYDCFTDSITLSNKIAYKQDSIFVQESQPTSEVTPEILNLKKDGHYFTVYFPEVPTKEMAGTTDISPWVYLVIMFLVVSLFFAFSVSIILRQNQLAEIKTDFINNMTHELKTPISTISLSAEMLLRTDPLETEKTHKYAGIIYKENKRLEHQVERVLNVAKLDKDLVILNKQAFNVNELLNEVKENFELHHLERGGNITIALNATNHLIQADSVHLTNLIYNLLDNAVKYCEGTPEIHIHTRNEKTGLWIEITDNGIGIKKENIWMIFEKFYRVPTGNLHNVKGFGLGLYYVKLIAEAHGGSILVKSVFGKGTTFSLFLP